MSAPANNCLHPHLPWKKTVAYKKNQFVHHHGGCFRAQMYSEGEEPAGTTVYWKLVAFLQPGENFACSNANHLPWKSYVEYETGRCVHYDGYCWRANGKESFGEAPGDGVVGWEKVAANLDPIEQVEPILLACTSGHAEWSGDVEYSPGDRVHRSGFCWKSRVYHKGLVPSPNDKSVWTVVGYSHKGMVTSGCSDLLHPAWSGFTHYYPGMFVHYAGVCWRANHENESFPPGPNNSGVMWDAMTPGLHSAKQEIPYTAVVCVDKTHGHWLKVKIYLEGTHVHRMGICWRAKVQTTAMEPSHSSPYWDAAAIVDSKIEPWATYTCVEKHPEWQEQLTYTSKLRVHHDMICWESTAGCVGFEPTLQQKIWIPKATVQIPFEIGIEPDGQTPLLSLTVVSTCQTCNAPRRFIESSRVKEVQGAVWILHRFRCDHCNSRYEFYSTNEAPPGLFSQYKGVMPDFSHPIKDIPGNPRLDALEF